MADRPIIMTAESVRAIQAGIKTQTRRVIKGFPNAGISEWQLLDCLNGVAVFRSSGERREIRCPYGVPGDTLWVRETWGEWGSVDGCVCYKADGDLSGIRGWRSPMFMPRWASRINLTIKDVRVERVQDISEADAIAEGATFHDGRPIGHHGWRHDFGSVYETARDSYAALWGRINAKRNYPWDANPWVWVVEWEAPHA